jgi:hypothetical protein
LQEEEDEQMKIAMMHSEIDQEPSPRPTEHFF